MLHKKKRLGGNWWDFSEFKIPLYDSHRFDIERFGNDIWDMCKWYAIDLLQNKTNQNEIVEECIELLKDELKIMKKYKPMYQDPATGEYRYKGNWYDNYPSEELEADEAAYEEYWDREYDRKRDEEGKWRK